MDRRLLDTYNRELQYIRELGGEFAKQYPKIASRLGLEGFECADPYVERLLEGFSFLAARVQLKLDAEFPRFTQHLLETVYPGYLAPQPSMALVQFQADPTEGSLAGGIPISRGSALRGVLGKGEQTACEYRTAHDVTLWPVELAEAEYVRLAGSTASLGVPMLPGAKAALRLRLRSGSGMRFDQLALDRLAFHLLGGEEKPMRLYEQLLGNNVGVVARPVASPPAWHEVLDKSSVRRVGFDDDEALLPVAARGFSGYRLLHEYFAFPTRFMFFELTHLLPAVKRCNASELDLVILFDRQETNLEGLVDAKDFALYCTPAINLFPRKADRVHLAERDVEHHLVPDRTRPMDYEVYEVVEVAGYAEGGERVREFQPFYSTHDRTDTGEHGAYFAARREPRLLSEKQANIGLRTGYLGSEVFVSLVDAREAPYQSDLRQLAVNLLCTNRDLPLVMPVGTGRTDFTLASGAPVRAVRCLAGPTRPREPLAVGESAWRLVSHLSLNYLSLCDSDEKQGAAALRELLGLYGDIGEPAIKKQIDGLRSVATKPVLRRITSGGMSAWVRGLEVTVTFDESAFPASGAFLLGAVMEQFFARYVSLNSFTETVVRTLERGEIVRWPARIGRRPTL